MRVKRQLKKVSQELNQKITLRWDGLKQIIGTDTYALCIWVGDTKAVDLILPSFNTKQEFRTLVIDRLR